jgi:molybdopterin molybdotransferase
MLTVDEARHLVFQHSRPKPPLRLPAADCLGLILAEDVASDIDSPPFDKAMVDGYAVRSADLVDGRGELEVIEEIIAGATAQRGGAAGQCWRIMTGAPIPAGADSVVMHEHTQFIGLESASERTGGDAASAFGRLGRVRIEEQRFRTGQNIMRRGTSLRRGDIVLSPGREIQPVEIGLLAEVGRTEVSVIGRPTVAILSTGNELVPPDRIPSAGQIRNSNGPMLAAATRAAGAAPIELGISRDEPTALRGRLAEGLRGDVLIISGGVSAGALDLVPGLLKELGVLEVFHKIRLKPGKPLWFGVRPASSLAPSPSSLSPTLVFGLPGNPVSSLVCFELFVRPALAQLAGKQVPEELVTVPARLTSDFVHRGDRPTFHPAKYCRDRESPTIAPLPWAGAADLRGLSAANALAIFAAGDREYAAGETIETLPLD